MVLNHRKGLINTNAFQPIFLCHPQEHLQDTKEQRKNKTKGIAGRKGQLESFLTRSPGRQWGPRPWGRTNAAFWEKLCERLMEPNVQGLLREGEPKEMKTSQQGWSFLLCLASGYRLMALEEDELSQLSTGASWVLGFSLLWWEAFHLKPYWHESFNVVYGRKNCNLEV